MGSITTLLLGLIYVSGTWTPSHYGIVLQLIGAPQLGPSVGTARGIRGDEWADLTPYFQIAVANKLAEHNESSPYNEPLRAFYALPTHDWSIIFKPQLWSFLLLPPEYAYSLYYYILMAAMIWGFTILFRQVGIRPYFAVCGALLIFLSRFVQIWWTSIAGTFAFAAWPLVAMLLPVAWWARLALVFYASAVWLFGLLYPPFIIGGAFALAGLLIALRRDALRPSYLLPAGVGVAAALLLVVWYFRDLIPIMRNTVYPGDRISFGGEVSWLEILSHLFPYIATVQFAPLHAGTNILEISTLASYLPLLIVVFADHRALAGKLRSERRTALAFGVSILLMLAWLVLPVPPELGQLFLWDRVPPRRLLWGFGLLTTFFSVWLVSLALWSISVRRAAIFFALVGAACLGTKWAITWTEAAWFDWVILAAVALTLPLAATARNQQVKGMLIVGSAVLTSAVTFGTFNPLQSAGPIFHPPASPMINGLKRFVQTHPKGWLAVTGGYGGVFAGLGLPSISHALLQPQLAFFRSVFPEMEQKQFNLIFNRFMYVTVAAVGKPRLESGDWYDDTVLLPITRFGAPLDLNLIGTEYAGHNEVKGQVVSITMDLDQTSWRLLMDGWVPFEDILPGQKLEIVLPPEIAQSKRGIRAVRDFRPELTEDVTEHDYRMGGFVIAIEGVGVAPPLERLRREIRVFSRSPDGRRYEARRAPANEVRVLPRSDSLASLPPQGNIDIVNLQDAGHLLSVFGWLPVGDALDGIDVYVNLPNTGATLTWENRPDVARAKAADHLLAGFKLEISLATPLARLPRGASLCLAASAAGKLTMRAHDNKDMPCR